MIIRESQSISRLTTNPLAQPNLTNPTCQREIDLNKLVWSLRLSGPLSYFSDEGALPRASSSLQKQNQTDYTYRTAGHKMPFCTEIKVSCFTFLGLSERQSPLCRQALCFIIK